MKKMLLPALLCVLVLGGCSSGEAPEVKKLNEQIERLKEENKSLTDRLIEENQSLSFSSDSNGGQDNSSAEDVEMTTRDFVKAQYQYKGADDQTDALKGLVTSNMLSMFQDTSIANSGNDSMKTESKVADIQVYSVSVEDEKATALVRVQTEFIIEENPPIVSEMLLELSLVKESDGVFRVNDQTVFNIVRN